jgi:hypothetical protein
MVSPVTTAATRPPSTLRWVVRLLGGETVTAALVAAWLAYGGFTAEVASLVDALAVAGFAAVLAAALGGLSFALSRRKPRARAPAIVLQLLGVVVAYFLTTVGLAWLSVPVAAVALLVVTLLLTPSTTAALTG